jgi:hypothetical protein
MIKTVQNLMDQSLLESENATYSELCLIKNLNPSLMDFLKILKIHKNVLYSKVENNERNVYKIKKSVESFGHNVDLLIEDIVKNKFNEELKKIDNKFKEELQANKMIINEYKMAYKNIFKKFQEQNEYLIKQNEVANNEIVEIINKYNIKKQVLFFVMGFISFCLYLTNLTKKLIPT